MIVAPYPNVYPGARLMPADPSNYRRGRGAPAAAVERVVIHCTDGHPEAEGIGQMWAKPGNKSSAHCCVGQDGAVIQSVWFADTAWHAHAVNATTIGVEHCARTPGEWTRALGGKNDPGLPPSPALYASSARLVAWVCATVIGAEPSREVVVGHAEADPQTTHARCPDGCGWDWDGYMALVRAEYAKLRQVA